jgi:catechol 2,3-dioxygenase-like lactoylglutathione lyase family enzyme
MTVIGCIRVTDLDAMQKFYEETIGFELVDRYGKELDVRTKKLRVIPLVRIVLK